MAEGGTPKKILVVDDDEIIAGLVTTILKTAGFDTCISMSGEEGLENVKSDKPDLVVLDIMMPGMSGLDVMLEMRSEPATRDIPILFLTSVDDEATVVKGLRGAEDYMVKPFKAQELEVRVDNILQRAAEIRDEEEKGAPLERLPLKVGGDTFLLPLGQIVFFEAAGKYCRVHTRKRGFLADYSIGDIESRLADRGFMRIHRSFVVNLSHVRKIVQKTGKRMTIVMSDDAQAQLNVSDSYGPELKARLGMRV